MAGSKNDDWWFSLAQITTHGSGIVPASASWHADVSHVRLYVKSTTSSSRHLLSVSNGLCWTVYNISTGGELGIDAAIAETAASCEANVSAVVADLAVVNANVTDALAAAQATALAAQAAQAEQAAAQAAAMSNVTATLAAVLGGLSALQTQVSSFSSRLNAVEANTGLLNSVVISPPMPPPSPPPPSPSPFSLPTVFSAWGSGSEKHIVSAAHPGLCWTAVSPPPTSGVSWSNPSFVPSNCIVLDNCSWGNSSQVFAYGASLPSHPGVGNTMIQYDGGSVGYLTNRGDYQYGGGPGDAQYNVSTYADLDGAVFFTPPSAICPWGCGECAVSWTLLPSGLIKYAGGCQPAHYPPSSACLSANGYVDPTSQQRSLTVVVCNENDLAQVWLVHP